MNFYKTKDDKRKRRHMRIRAKISGTPEMPRLAVFKSNSHIYVQIIDDIKGVTLAAASDAEVKKQPKPEKGKKDAKSGKIGVAYEVGKLIAEKASKIGVKRAVFDRGGNQYHGRIKAVADGAREGGIKI